MAERVAETDVSETFAVRLSSYMDFALFGRPWAEEDILDRAAQLFDRISHELTWVCAS
jgi:hypothetical protein